MLSQIKYKTEQFLLEFNRRYDGIKVMYLALLILLSTAFLLSMFSRGPIPPSDTQIKLDQMITDIEIINGYIDEIQSDLDEMIGIMEKQNAKN